MSSLSHASSGMAGSSAATIVGINECAGADTSQCSPAFAALAVDDWGRSKAPSHADTIDSACAPTILDRQSHDQAPMMNRLILPRALLSWSPNAPPGETARYFPLDLVSRG